MTLYFQLKIYYKDALAWPGICSTDTSSRGHFGDFSSVMSVQHSIIVLKMNLTWEDRWKIVKSDRVHQRRLREPLRSSSWFLTRRCRRLKNLHFLLKTDLGKSYVAIFIFLRIFSSSHEKHVLKVVSQALSFNGIGKRADIDAERRSWFCSILVGDDKTLNVVVESKRAICSFVADTLDYGGIAHPNI